MVRLFSCNGQEKCSEELHHLHQLSVLMKLMKIMRLFRSVFLVLKGLKFGYSWRFFGGYLRKKLHQLHHFIVG